MTSLSLLTAYDSARAEFISDAEDRWQGGKGSAVRDCERLEELARISAKFQAEASALISALEVGANSMTPHDTTANRYHTTCCITESIVDWLTPEAHYVYSAALACDLEPKEVVRGMLKASLEDSK